MRIQPRHSRGESCSCSVEKLNPGFLNSAHHEVGANSFLFVFVFFKEKTAQYKNVVDQKPYAYTFTIL